MTLNDLERGRNGRLLSVVLTSCLMFINLFSSSDDRQAASLHHCTASTQTQYITQTCYCLYVRLSKLINLMFMDWLICKFLGTGVYEVYKIM